MHAEILTPLQPEVQAWVTDNALAGNSFAISLQQYYRRTGRLTENQVQAVIRKLPTAAPKAPVSLAGEGFTKLLDAFNHAKEVGLKRPKLTTGSLAFSLAPEHGKNPGFIYIKHQGEYAGKVSPQGVFSKAFETSPDTVTLITLVGKDPLAEAVRHGHKTGDCAVCGRRLSDEESVQRGIGPVCAKNYGWVFGTQAAQERRATLAEIAEQLTQGAR